ncbi:diguanylate cyclase [Pseudoroseomonas globiformis]|uniref:diguanylate cyclase n=1 Tax=Teichococcus globiformis TaxID=2307229 RepID=A0ABV7G184_9PROT
MRRLLPPAAAPSSLARPIMGLILLACALLAGLQVWHSLSERRERLRSLEVEAANLARSLAQHTDDRLQMASAILAGASERVLADGTGPAARQRLDRILRAQATTFEGGADFLILDAEGAAVAGTPAGRRIADIGQELSAETMAAAAQPERGTGDVQLRAPVYVPARRGWVIPLQRRIETPQGEFAGLALALLDAGTFAQYFARFDLGPNGAVALLDTKGRLLSRHPFQRAAIGRSLAGFALFRDKLPRQTADSFTTVSPVDGVRRIAAYQQARSFPLVVLVARARDPALAGWRTDTLWRGGVTLVVTGLLALLGLRLGRALGRRQQSERLLAESEASFRLLAERSSDVVVRLGLDGRRRYVSPASEALLGHAPTALMGGMALDEVEEADRAEVQDALARLLSGEAEQMSLACRMRHADGRLIWVEAAIRATFAPVTGQPDGAVAVLRDITAHKAREAELATQAGTDGLTGLLNRRRFDEVLRREWDRAAREGTALSLLMLDIDRFKLFNDRYGHPAGDGCLRRVAVAVAAAVRRPGDMVARYGGEELAVILPRTDAAGAASVAESVRAAVAAELVPHEGNPPVMVVTSSLGAATAEPRPGLAFGPEALVAAADGALYGAKRSGRNQVAMADNVPPLPPSAPRPVDEASRLAAVEAFRSAGATAPGDVELERIARVAAMLFGMPMALISVVGRDRTDFAATHGLDAEGASRDDAFCSHAIAGSDDTLVVPDLATDPRFAGNPLTVAPEGFRFYAGAVLRSPEGDHRLGTLCVLDRSPHPPLNTEQKALLADLAALAVQRLEQRRLAPSTVS